MSLFGANTAAAIRGRKAEINQNLTMARNRLKELEALESIAAKVDGEPIQYTRDSVGIAYGVVMVSLHNAAGDPIGIIAATRDFSGTRGAAGRADYVAVNISSPNTKGLRDLQEETALRNLLRSLKEEQDRLAQHHGASTPLALKISPVSQISQQGEHVQRK